MGISLKVIIYLMTASVSLSVTGNKGGPVNIIYWDGITPMAETHNAGETAQIKCSYPDNHESNEKFLCKEQNPSNCEELIHTTEQDRDVGKGRFNIRDNRRLKYFYVLIKNLSTADSGTYWCGSNRTWQHAKFNKNLLSEAERHIKTKESREDTNTKPSSSDDHAGLIGGVVGGLAFLLILVVVLVLLVRHKLPWTQVCCAAGGSSEQMPNAGHNTEGNHGDHHYEEIQMRKQQASSGDALPSVYATVNPPADQLHYASVNFQKDSVSVSTDGNALPDTNKNSSLACDYSISRTQGATHPPAAEQTFYSTVTTPGKP